MLENIKSSFFIKIIFTFLYLNKIKLVKYSKSLQNKKDISLINYKILSQRYIVNEENEKIKENMGYNYALKFEEEYSNGERNGKGREYDYKGKLKFEGEYLNGKRNGKRYDNNNNIICEIKNGSGYIKEFFGFDELIFENEYFNGERNGKGKEYH